jgi:Flp pilus assembly protein TadD
MKVQSRFRKTASRADVALAQAVAAVNEADMDRAERIVRDVLTKDPQHADAMQLLGAVLLAQQRPREAVAPLEAVARASANPEVETHLAIALREIGRPAEALKWLYLAVEREPPYARAFQELGDLLRTQCEYTEAEAVLKRGVEAAPTMRELSLTLGGVYLDRADPANAKMAFARVLAISPGDPDALMGVGIALQYEGDFAQAADRFRQVLASDPAHPRARMNLGYCLIELGRIDEGLACLRATVQAAPHVHGSALRMLIAAGRGRFWLRRGCPIPGSRRSRAGRIKHIAIGL